jgi:endoglucanase
MKLGFVLTVFLSCLCVRAQTPAHDAALHYRRGVNFGNHLEQARFSEDHYKPADYEMVKREGFDHIRIPIGWHHHTGPAPDFIIDPKFFAIVDGMVEQSRKQGLYTIINDHHFDDLTSDPWAFTNKFYAMWKQIAAHYAKQSDVAFELLNEPKDRATAEVMNTIWADGIRVIRSVAPERVIFVGTARWNSIDELPKLKLPENDRNLIVTLHCYDPFYFTHQGASWAGSDPSTVGIVFPGPPKTPIEKSPKATNQWVAKWIADYNKLPTEQNPSSPRAFRPKLERAAKWGKENNRPIHLGEFGAIILADPQSRANFYREMRQACDENGIGWAIWDWNAMFHYQKNGQPDPPAMRDALFAKKWLPKGNKVD